MSDDRTGDDQGEEGLEGAMSGPSGDDDRVAGWPEGGPTEATGLPSTGSGAIAPMPQRIFGRMVDTTLEIVVLVAILLATAEDTTETVDGVTETTTTVPVWATLLGLLLWYLYETIAVGLTGRTLGKRLARTRVVDRATGRRPSFYRAGLRVLVAVAALLIGGPAVGGILLVLIYGSAVAGGSLYRNLPDRVARTIVVLA